MTDDRDHKIQVDVPITEARRDRVEREVFARLDAMRDVDRANTFAPVKKSRMPLVAAGFVFVAAAASIALLATREAPPQLPSAPSLVVTPAGGSSRFTVGDAVIDAGSDTSVEVKHEANGGTTLLLARGSVDCDVTPRPNRAPFRVLSGDVTVEVVGTRFAVSRVGSGSAGGTVTRVDVMRGKVKVHGNGEQRFIVAGDSWTSAPITAAITPQPTVEPIVEPPVVAAVEPEEIELPAESARRPSPPPSPTALRPAGPKAAYEAAVELQKRNEKQAARAFRSIANGNHAWAALSLFSLADIQSKSDVDATLATLDELAKRFPNAGNAEDAAWFRVEVLRDARRTDEARKAANVYMRTFPHGTYVKLATRFVRPATP